MCISSLVKHKFVKLIESYCVRAQNSVLILPLYHKMTNDNLNGNANYYKAAFVLHETTPNEVARAMIEDGRQNEPFYIFNMDEAYRRILHFRKMMPRVQIFYAMKANDSEMMLKLAIALGLGFDCASPGEINKVLQLNINPKSIIFAVPTKTPDQMTFARDAAVSHTTFDTLYELKKMKQFWPDARALIRIKVDSECIYNLGDKFGCDAETEAVDLLEAAAALGIRDTFIGRQLKGGVLKNGTYDITVPHKTEMIVRTLSLHWSLAGLERPQTNKQSPYSEVVGVAFHVGSACSSIDSHMLGLKKVKALFDHEARAGRRMFIVDIGGGFLSDRTDRIDEVSKLINRTLEEYFPEPDIQVIAEPGRYICDSSTLLYCNINNVRTVKKENEIVNMIYLNDGLYGTLRYNEPWQTVKKFQMAASKADGNLENTILWGPSCDSTDRVMLNCTVRLPKCTPLDWLVFESQGAYSFGFATEFSCLPKPLIRSVVSEELWHDIKEREVFSAADFVLNPHLEDPLPSTLPKLLNKDCIPIKAQYVLKSQ